MSDQELECLGEAAGVPADFNFLQELELFESHTGRRKLPPSPPPEKTKTTGRPQAWETKVLALFHARRGSAPLKKEYLRCKLIRGHKKALRKINKARVADKSMHNYDALPERNAIWQAMGKLFNEAPALFQTQAQISSGPCTDSRRKGYPPVTFKSFNEDFCQVYFQPILIRRSFVLYLDLVFGDCSPSLLIKHFKFFCCNCPAHSPDCITLWQELKLTILQKFVRNVDLTLYVVEDLAKGI